MKIFGLISSGVNALRKGEILAHPARWKTAQAVSMALVAVVVPVYSALCPSADVCYGISQDQVTQIATWAGGIAFAVFQIWTTFATSEKVGIGRNKKSNADLADIIRASPIARMREPERSDRAEQLPSGPAGRAVGTRHGDTSGQGPESADYFGNFGPD